LLANIDRVDYRCVPPLFRPPFFRRVVEGSHKKILSEVLVATAGQVTFEEDRPLKAILNQLYKLLSLHYRCEYVFKNIIANQLFLNRHDILQSYLTDEFRAGISRADVVVLNGTSTVYEIKTELDSFAKLPSQLADYRRLFDRLCIVVPKELVRRTIKISDEAVGIIEISDELSVSTVREPQSNKRFTSPAHIFDCMRRAEYEACVAEAFVKVDDVPSGRRHSVLKALFTQLTPEDAHDLMVRHVRRRGISNSTTKLLSSVPKSLVHACLTLNESTKFTDRLAAILNEPVGAV